MSRRRRLVFVVLVALQAAVPLAVIGTNELALAQGTEVVLRTVPVDPVDLFRGRYVTLRYEVSSVAAADRFEAGDRAYVPLREQGGRSVGLPARRSPPETGPFIRGRVSSSVAGRVELTYGIEQYYADEDEARRLEREGATGLDVTVVLDDDGRPRISGVEAVR